MKIKAPKPGQIVEYFNGGDEVYNGQPTTPAIITSVQGKGVVTLQVFHENSMDPSYRPRIYKKTDENHGQRTWDFYEEEAIDANLNFSEKEIAKIVRTAINDMREEEEEKEMKKELENKDEVKE